jgi:1-deoxy-D-xylulose-5-phosphate synthase
MGSAILEFMGDHGYAATVHRLGIPDHFVEQGSLAELHHECGFDTAGIIRSVKKMLGE